jgi:ribosome-associated protein
MKESHYYSESNKILKQEEKYPFPLNFAMMGAWLMAQFKGTEIKIFQTPQEQSLADFFVLCSVSNPMQAQAILREIELVIKTSNEKILSKEGENSGEWLLVDIGDVIFHIFQDSSRDIFALDELWSKYNSVEIPQDFYFSNIKKSNLEQDDQSSNDYF